MGEGAAAYERRPFLWCASVPACLFSNPNISLLVNSLSSWGITYLKDKVSSVVSKNRLLSITGENQCSVKSKVTRRQTALTGESRGDKRSLSTLTKLIKSGDSTWHLQHKGEQAALLLFRGGFKENKHTPFCFTVIKACLPCFSHMSLSLNVLYGSFEKSLILI